MPDPRATLRWDRGLGRYRDAGGRLVSAAAVRRDLDRALDASAAAMSRVSRQLATGRLDLISWELAMRAEIRRVQLYSAAVATGGVAQMSASDLGRVGAAVREQFRYLARFAQQIEAGLPLDGRFLLRVTMYAEAGRSVYHRTERAQKKARGFRFERNLLALSDHCAGCVEETARGLVEIGALVPIGERTCLTRCRCSIVYAKTAD